MKNLKRNIFLTALVAIWLIVPLTATAQKNASGMDEIFVLIGQEKPADWANWTRDQRFEFMENMGLYPQQDRAKYQGQIDGLTDYFAWLGIEEPSNWSELSFEERQAIVAAAQQVQSAPPDLNLDKAEPLVVQQEKPPGMNLKLILVVIGVLLGAAIIYASYKIDYLRLNRNK